MPYKYRYTNPYRYRHCNHMHDDSEFEEENECRSAHTSSSGFTTNLSRSTYLSRYLNHPSSIEDDIKEAEYLLSKRTEDFSTSSSDSDIGFRYPSKYIDWNFRLRHALAERELISKLKEDRVNWKNQELRKRADRRAKEGRIREFRDKLKVIDRDSIDYEDDGIKNGRIECWLEGQRREQHQLSTSSNKRRRLSNNTSAIQNANRPNITTRRSTEAERDDGKRNSARMDREQENEIQYPNNDNIKRTRYNLRPRKPLRNSNLQF